MRSLPLVALAFIPALALAACAEDGDRYDGPRHHRDRVDGPGDDLTRLQNDCQARGGLLVPTGRNTNQPAVDNVCKLDPAGPRPGR